jgi:hypothetical protein
VNSGRGQGARRAAAPSPRLRLLLIEAGEEPLGIMRASYGKKS